MRAQILISAILLAFSSASYAALGGAPSAPKIDVTGVAPKVMKQASASYTTNDTTLASGTRVREYIAADGVVFAVSWQGPFAPDLKELLGTHFDTMVQERTKKPKAGNSQLMVKQGDLVIHSRGHMRSFEGVAYLASKLPSGVSINDIH